MQIRDKIGVQVLYNLNEAKNMAMKADRRGFEGLLRNPIDKEKERRMPNSEKEDKVTRKKPTETIRNYKPVNPTTRTMAGKCYRCLQPGHKSNDCPDRRNINMVEREAEDEICCEPDGDDEGGQFDDVNDEGEHNFVIRKLMLAPKQQNTTQRHQLFRTGCTINGQVFDLIIDSGSCENIIGKKVVKSLQLTTEKHPEPYSIGWIKSTEKVKVTERCRVSFSIRKYKDEVYCDVVDMDACHLLFGRPWQFDVDAQHNGRENVYRLEKGGVKFTLLPLKVTKCLNTSSADRQSHINFLNSEKELEAAVREAKVVHAMIVKQIFSLDGDPGMEVPEAIKFLLDEFSEVITEDLPNGLPPM